VILNIGDFISTKLVIGVTGAGAEVNPIAQWIIITVGIYALIPFKAIACWLIWKWKHRITNTVMAAVNVIFVVVVIGNFYNYYSLGQV